MCWPPGEADRRYAGVTHLDVTRFDDAEAGRSPQAAATITACRSPAWATTPTRSTPTRTTARVVAEHLRKVIDAAAKLLGVGVVNTFIGRDSAQIGRGTTGRCVCEVWPAWCGTPRRPGVQDRHRELPDAVLEGRMAGRQEPGDVAGDLAAAVRDVAEPALGLNFDPSHLVWQYIDAGPGDPRVRPAHRPRPRQGRADRPATGSTSEGILGLGWHAAEAAGPGRRGLGRVLRGADRRRLRRAGVHRGGGPGLRGVAGRPQRSLRQSKRFLEQFVS